MGRGPLQRPPRRDRRARRPDGAAAAAAHPRGPGRGVRRGDLQGRFRVLGPDQAVHQGQGGGVRKPVIRSGATGSSAATLGSLGQPPPAPVGARTTNVSLKVEELDAAAYEIPTDQHESDGTYEWDSTTIVVVEAFNGHERGIGYTYADRSAATLIESKLASIARGQDAMRPPSVWKAMRREIRNAGQP